jgi:hypothetical protein
MNRSNLLIQAGRGVKMKVVTEASLQKEELKVKTEDTCAIYSIIKDITYSIHEV